MCVWVLCGRDVLYGLLIDIVVWCLFVVEDCYVLVSYCVQELLDCCVSVVGIVDYYFEFLVYDVYDFFLDFGMQVLDVDGVSNENGSYGFIFMLVLL